MPFLPESSLVCRVASRHFSKELLNVVDPFRLIRRNAGILTIVKYRLFGGSSFQGFFRSHDLFFAGNENR